MHTVIRHLAARRNKKIPCKDGKKIVLVLFGGLMTGVRGAGAMIALEELGLRFAFDSMYVISAGFANASYFLSGQPRFGTSIYYDDMANQKFINLLRPWKFVDIDYMIRVMKTTKALDTQAILDHPTKLFVRLLDARRKKIMYLEAHDVPVNEYMGLMEAATSIAFLHPGSTKIGKSSYKDPDFRAHQLPDHMKKVLSSGATDILVIYNNLGQYNSLTKTIQLPTSRVFEIYPDSSWRLSRFATNGEKLKNAAMQMGKLVKRIFGENMDIDLSYEHRH